jgi:hypothetical protein
VILLGETFEELSSSVYANHLPESWIPRYLEVQVLS